MMGEGQVTHIASTPELLKSTQIILRTPQSLFSPAAIRTWNLESEGQTDVVLNAGGVALGNKNHVGILLSLKDYKLLSLSWSWKNKGLN